MQPLSQASDHASDQAHEFVVVGLGAIGTLFASHLSQRHDCHALMAAGAGHQVADSVARRRLLGENSARLIELPLVSSLRELAIGRRSQPVHLWVLLCCKATVANRLLPLLMQALKDLTLEHDTCRASLVIMQNGLQTHTLASAAFNAVFAKHHRVRLLAASTTEAARREPGEPGTVYHSAVGETTIGRLDDQLVEDGPDPALTLSDLLNASGLIARPVDHIEAILWNKLALNAIVNPLTALHRCRNGELPTLPDYRRLASPLAGEVLGAWRHWGAQNQPGSAIVIPATVDELLARVDDICRRTAANRSSMLQDVLAGRSTEIDAINGYIIDYCEQHGLPCRANRELVKALAALTHTNQTKDQDYGKPTEQDLHPYR